MSVEYRPVSERDVHDLINNMREADRKELERFSLIDATELVMSSVKSSELSASAFIDGGLVAILGVCPASLSPINVIGVPWMLGTNLLAKNSRVFFTEYDGIVQQMLSRFSVLENYVDVENRQAVQFLKRIGFKFYDPEPIGVNGHLFYKFTMRA